MASARFDLHAHTTASDGSLAPRELVALAVDRGLAGIAITDHDTIEGLAEARATAMMLGIRLVPGVEISCSGPDGRQVHLLAYLFDVANEDLLALLEQLRNERHSRALEMVEKLQGHGVEITIGDVLEQSGGRAPGRPHVARALLARGHVVDTDAAFTTDFIGIGGRGFVSRFGVPVTQAIDIVHSAGGVAVLAHPGRGRNGVSSTGIRAAAAAGIDGIEVDHPDHNEDAVRECADLAVELNLVQTGGSDDHGAGMEGPRLACRTVSDRILTQLEARAERWRVQID